MIMQMYSAYDTVLPGTHFPYISAAVMSFSELSVEISRRHCSSRQHSDIGSGISSVSLSRNPPEARPRNMRASEQTKEQMGKFGFAKYFRNQRTSTATSAARRPGFRASRLYIEAVPRYPCSMLQVDRHRYGDMNDNDSIGIHGGTITER